MIIDLTALGTEIELAAARATVNQYGPDAIWIAASSEGAVLRASLCLKAGYPPSEVSDALDRYTDTTAEMAQQTRDRHTRRNGAL